MNKKVFNFLSISTFLCAGALMLGSITGCGPKRQTEEKPEKPEEGGDTTQKSDTFQTVVEKPKQTLSLGEGLVVTQPTTKYFAPQVVRRVGDGETASWEYVSNGGEALLLSGEEVSLQAYGVPEGWSIGCTVMDGMGVAESSGLTIGSDGKIVAPAVTEKTDFLVWLYATSPNKDLTFNGTAYADTVRKSIRISVIPKELLASGGIYQFSGLSAADRTEIAASLEKFALKNGLTGVTLSNNGGYNLYNSRISAPLLDTNRYLAGYGFGTDLYGKITAPLESEKTEKYKMYWHEWEDAASDQGNFNYLNSSEAAVSDYYNRISSSYWYTPLNEDNTAYEYRGFLAREDAPEPLNLQPDGTATKWKIKLRVGADADGENGATKGLTYRINTKVDGLKQFDKRKIKLEDYLTPFKLLSMKSVGWFRGAELAAEETANRQVKGLAEFYNASEDMKTLPTDEEFSKKVGASIDHSDNSLTIEFNAGFTEEFAIYQLQGLWTNPIPAEFILELGRGAKADSSPLIEGARLYGTSPEGKTPLDTILSVGPYYTESYVNKQFATFAKNEDWFLKKDAYGRDIYQIEGYHVKASTKIGQDENALIMAFEAGEIDASNIPDEYWDKYLTDPRKKKVEGSQTQKLTFNTCDKALHDSMFGEGGPWYESFNQGQFEPWEVKPIASNRNFFYGLNLAIDRIAFADKYHVVPSIDYQPPIAKVTPVTTELYNSSEAHKKVISDIYGDALANLEESMTFSIGYLEAGIAEELEAGHYDLGTGEKPTVIKLTAGTIDEQVRKDRLALVGQNWVDAVNRAVQTHIDYDQKNHWVDEAGKPRIVFKLDVQTVPSDTSFEGLIQNGLWIGHWDIQFAYLIIGNAYDVLNGLNILMSSRMGGFELNFGADTTIPSSDIFYDGKYWSFESLWQAANGGAVIDPQGAIISEFFKEDSKTVKVGTRMISPAEGEEPIKALEVSMKLDEALEGLDVTTDGATAYYAIVGGKLQMVGSPFTSTYDKETKTLTLLVPFESASLPAGTVIDPKFEGQLYAEIYIQFVVTDASGNSATFEFVWGDMYEPTVPELE